MNTNNHEDVSGLLDDFMSKPLPTITRAASYKEPKREYKPVNPNIEPVCDAVVLFVEQQTCKCCGCYAETTMFFGLRKSSRNGSQYMAYNDSMKPLMRGLPHYRIGVPTSVEVCPQCWLVPEIPDDARRELYHASRLTPEADIATFAKQILQSEQMANAED